MTTLATNTWRDVFLACRQAPRSAGSTGQGARLLRHWTAPDTAIAMPATAKIAALCSLSQTSWGRAETSEDSAAPAPIATSIAGMAQHTSVVDVASSVATALHRLPRAWAMPSSITSCP